MFLKEISDLTGAKLLTPSISLQTPVTCACCCDLLSNVLAHGREGMAWITVHTHMNVVAIASLRRMACVIVSCSDSVPADVCAKAEEEGIAVLSSEKDSYELCGLLYRAGLQNKY